METYFAKNISFYIECGNLMCNLDQQHDLQRQTQNETFNVRKIVTSLCAYVALVDVEKQ
jgi:hypothetical protein